MDNLDPDSGYTGWRKKCDEVFRGRGPAWKKIAVGAFVGGVIGVLTFVEDEEGVFLGWAATIYFVLITTMIGAAVVAVLCRKDVLKERMRNGKWVNPIEVLLFAADEVSFIIWIFAVLGGVLYWLTTLR